IETLEGIRSTVVSDHILNLLEDLGGKLPEAKPKMLEAIDRYLALPDEDRLRFRVGRRLGYLRTVEDLDDVTLRLRVDQIIDQVRGSLPEERRRDTAGIEKEIYEVMENYI
ncbi:MAG TPA: radical SAM protein, partial [Thermodesulfobacteriota bacterium]|nr:radical SAM protein [Thermodesulfobacteriota bacterium]